MLFACLSFLVGLHHTSTLEGLGEYTFVHAVTPVIMVWIIYGLACYIWNMFDPRPKQEATNAKPMEGYGAYSLKCRYAMLELGEPAMPNETTCTLP